MSARGRKRKQEIKLTNDNAYDTTSLYLNYPEESISKQSLIWEYKNPETKLTDVYTYPLSRNAAISHWKNEVELGINQSAQSMLTRIIDSSHEADKERQIYDEYPQQSKLIDHLLYSASSLCMLKNSTRRSGSQYASAIAALIKFFTNNFTDINDIFDIDEHKQTILYNDLSKADSTFYSGTSVKTIAKNILIYSLNREGLDSETLSQQIKHKSHSGKKTRIDYPQEVTIQLLSESVTEINKIKKKYNQYLSWKKKYKDKPFDSLENIAKAFITIPENFLNKKTSNGKNVSIYRYQEHYENLSLKLHNISLRSMNSSKLEQLAKNGFNIDKMDDPGSVRNFVSIR